MPVVFACESTVDWLDARTYVVYDARVRIVLQGELPRKSSLRRVSRIAQYVRTKIQAHRVAIAMRAYAWSLPPDARHAAFATDRRYDPFWRVSLPRGLP